jgi:CBS domain-containing protein
MNTAGAAVTAKTTVREVMTTDLVTLKLDDTLRLADDLLSLAHVRHFPVLDGDRLAGIINQNDLLHASMASLLRRPKEPPRAALGTVTVKEVMKPATTVAPETRIRDAARDMVDRGIECLLIMDGNKLVGLVTRTDLLRELAKI